MSMRRKFAAENRRKRVATRRVIYPMLVRTKTGQILTLGSLVPSEQPKADGK